MNSEQEHREQQFTFISPDIASTKDARIDPGQELFVPILSTVELTDFNRYLKYNTVPGGRRICHTRSHLMQVGVQADIREGRILLSNIGPNSVIVENGRGICNVVALKSKPLAGDNLLNHIASNDIAVTGSWQYWEESDEEGRIVPIGLELPVNDEVRYRVKKTELILFMRDQAKNGTHNRGLLDNFLEKGEKSNKSHFWVGELESSLYISSHAHGIITGIRDVGELSGDKSEYEKAEHGPSVLLRGGQTGQNPNNGLAVRIEINGPSEGPGCPELVRVQFYPA